MRPRHSWKHRYKKIILFVPISLIVRCDYVANLLCTWTHHCTRHACTYRYIAMICTPTVYCWVQPSKHRWHFCKRKPITSVNSQRQMRSRCLSATLCYQFIVHICLLHNQWHVSAHICLLHNRWHVSAHVCHTTGNTCQRTSRSAG